MSLWFIILSIIMITNKEDLVISGNVAAALLLLLLGWSVWVIGRLQPPAPKPADAPPEQFSAWRARRHIEAIAAQPRPAGTTAHQRARDYIVTSLATIGIKAQRQAGTVTSTRWGLPFDSANVENIVAELPGQANSKIVLLICHYDSVPNSPGASDNGSGVAALLETARALKAGPPLKNSIRLLFTDAEEGGALGAQAFAARAQNLAGLGLVVNFDARGHRGASALIDTSPQNSYLIRELSRALPSPVASSAYYEVARRLGHATDFRPFKEAGLQGFNFAFSEGVTHYHTPIDNIANLDLGSLQHQGENALSIARHFGSLELNDGREQDAVYFNNIGAGLIIYGQRYVLPILAAISLIFALALWRVRRRANIKPIVITILAFCGLMATTAALVSALNWLVRQIHVDYQLMATGDTYNAGYYRSAYVALAITLFLALYQRLRPRITLINFAIGIACVWQILLIATTIWTPGASYICAWPLAAFLLAIIFHHGRARYAVIVIAAMLGIFLIAPVPYLIFVALQLSRAGLAAAVVTALSGLLIFIFDPILLHARWLLVAAGCTLVIAMLVAVSFTARFDSNHPLPTSLAYAFDTDQGKAYWFSEDRYLNEYSSQYIEENARLENAPEFFPDESILIRRGAAPIFSELRGPALTVLDDRTENGIRRVRVRIKSARNANWLYLFLASQHTVVLTAINGEIVKGEAITRRVKAGGWGFRHMNLPPEGLEWVIEVAASDRPLEVIAIDQSFGLTELGAAVKALPADMMPARSWIANSILVRSSFRF